MIFHSSKISIAKKKIAQLVEEQSGKKFPPSPKTLGIILDAKNEDALKELIKLKDVLNIQGKKFKVLFFSASKSKPESWDVTAFNLQDFDEKAEISNEEIQEISSQGVDLLITFAAENNTTAHLLTAHFKAGLKVGRFQQNAALYDLILQTEDDEKLFVEELLKYISHLTKKK